MLRLLRKELLSRGWNEKGDSIGRVEEGLPTTKEHSLNNNLHGFLQLERENLES